MLVITQQIKAARALLGWGQYDLAVKSGIAISTVRRLERSSGSLCAHFETIAKIRSALEGAGVSFSGEPYPGVSLGRSQEKLCD
jgi:transcriptional regulator with XRE-family HTH domain